MRGKACGKKGPLPVATALSLKYGFPSEPLSGISSWVSYRLLHTDVQFPFPHWYGW